MRFHSLHLTFYYYYNDLCVWGGNIPSRTIITHCCTIIYKFSLVLLFLYFDWIGLDVNVAKWFGCVSTALLCGLLVVAEDDPTGLSWGWVAKLSEVCTNLLYHQIFRLLRCFAPWDLSESTMRRGFAFCFLELLYKVFSDMEGVNIQS